MTKTQPYPEAIEQAILTALDDEYHAEATYGAILKRFGDVRPFSNIIEAERRHSAALTRLLNACGKAAPQNPYLTGEKSIEPVPASISEACETAIAAEVANVALYDDTLLPLVAPHPEVTAVFQRLRDASANRHLPAFQRCAGRHGAVAADHKEM